MGFYYAVEKKRFEQEWSKLRVEYAKAGMSAEDIENIYKFDLETFCSQRTYINHTQPLPNTYISGNEAENSTLFRKFGTTTFSFSIEDFSGRYDWVEMIENQRLASLLRQLSEEDLELLTFLVLEEHSQRELAQKWGCTQKTISARFNRIRKFLGNF